MEQKERKVTAVYTNRYRENRYLHDDGKGQIWMTGNIISLRLIGGNVENGKVGDISAVDPDGGPYISVGEDVGLYYKDGYSRIVERIEVSGVIKLWYKIEQDDNR